MAKTNLFTYYLLKQDDWYNNGQKKYHTGCSLVKRILDKDFSRLSWIAAEEFIFLLTASYKQTWISKYRVALVLKIKTSIIIYVVALVTFIKKKYDIPTYKQ